MENPFTRRRFLKHSTAASAVAFSGSIINRVWSAQSEPASPRSAAEKLNVGIIGANGRGKDNTLALAKLGCNIVALCDVDEGRLGDTARGFPNAKQYGDWRKLLEQKDVDAVVVATPDHMHAFASIAAMQLGKDVYCEKPLTHSIYEARMMRETAQRCKVATQMGHGGHASEGTRLTVEWIQSGIIGAVKEVHVWTDRPIWPQGVSRPKPMSAPKNLNWDLWLGPAPQRPYNPAYHPFAWRGWFDFGTGALGDMGCHVINAAYWALKLGAPTTVEAAAWFCDETYPEWSIIRYQFPQRGDLPPVKMTWYDGGRLPNRPRELEPERQFAKQGGTLFVGEKGKLLCSTAQAPRLIPESTMKDLKRPEPFLPRSPGHHQEWINACKGNKLSSANFDYSVPLTEIVLLGNVAIRARKKIEWDGENMRVTNAPEANQFIRREYRKGWEL